MRRSLSSRITALNMAAPVVVLLLYAGMFAGLKTARVPLLPGILFGTLLIIFWAILARFSWLLCFASMDESRLYLKSYRGSDEVPLARIQSLKARGRARSRYIEIAFSAPTKLGARVALIPTLGFTSSAFLEVYEALAKSVRAAGGEVSESSVSKARDWKNIQAALVVWVLIVVAAVVLIRLGNPHQ